MDSGKVILARCGQARRVAVALAALPAIAGCAQKAQPTADPFADAAAILIVENTTPQQVSVFFIDRATHVRLGFVEPRSEARLPVRKAVLHNRRVFRIYAFRGLEPCPVARILDISASRTPRVTVAASDSVLSAYLSADVCRTGKR